MNPVTSRSHEDELKLVPFMTNSAELSWAWSTFLSLSSTEAAELWGSLL